MFHSYKILTELNFSAWVQISEGSETVAVIFRTIDGKFIHGGYVLAKHGCWSLLKGGMVAHFSGPVEILFEVKCEIILAIPFSQQKYWNLHQTWCVILKQRQHKRIEFNLIFVGTEWIFFFAQCSARIQRWRYGLTTYHCSNLQ